MLSVFVCGASGYLLFALYFVVNSKELLKQRNRLWNRLRAFNLFVVSLELLYQAPFFHPPTASECPLGNAGCFTWQTFLGFTKYCTVSIPHRRGTCEDPFSPSSALGLGFAVVLRE